MKSEHRQNEFLLFANIKINSDFHLQNGKLLNVEMVTTQPIGRTID